MANKLCKTLLQEYVDKTLMCLLQTIPKFAQ